MILETEVDGTSQRAEPFNGSGVWIEMAAKERLRMGSFFP